MCHCPTRPALIHPSGPLLSRFPHGLDPMTRPSKILRRYRGSLLFLIAPSILLFVTVKEVRAHTAEPRPALVASERPAAMAAGPSLEPRIVRSSPRR